MIGTLVKLAILGVLAIIAFAAISPAVPSAGGFPFESMLTSDTFWFLVFVGLILLAWALPKPAKIPLGAAAGVVAFGWIFLNLSSGIDSGFGWFKRCVNAECSAEATDYDVYDGGVLKLASREKVTVIITNRKVRVPNLTCHTPDIDPKPEVTWDPGFDNIYLRAMNGLSRQVVTVSLIPTQTSWACKQFWKDTVS